MLVILSLRFRILKRDGEIIYPDEDGRFVLTSDKKKITIPCFIFNYSLVNPQVSYRLEGFDKEVTVVDRSEFESASYTNLPGGTYHFLLQVKDSLGDEGRELSVEIVKEKAFYEQIWFILSADHCGDYCGRDYKILCQEED